MKEGMSQHSVGKAVDIMFINASKPNESNYQSELDKGYALYERLKANAVALNITELIWQNKLWTLAGGEIIYSEQERQDKIPYHLDHIHVSLSIEGTFRSDFSIIKLEEDSLFN